MQSTDPDKSTSETARVIALDKLGMADVPRVGGKNASLGEMIGRLSDAGIRVPGGFATTTFSFREFLDESGLVDKTRARIAQVDVDDVGALAKAGSDVRRWIVESAFPAPFVEAVTDAYRALERESPNATFAVRSSATAEDLADASFAGQQETFLNIKG